MLISRRTTPYVRHGQTEIRKGAREWTFFLKPSSRGNHRGTQGHGFGGASQSTRKIQIFKLIQGAKFAELEEQFAPHEDCLVTQKPADGSISKFCQQAGESKKQRWRIESARKTAATDLPTLQRLFNLKQSFRRNQSICVQEQHNFASRALRTEVQLRGTLRQGRLNELSAELRRYSNGSICGATIDDNQLARCSVLPNGRYCAGEMALLIQRWNHNGGHRAQLKFRTSCPLVLVLRAIALAMNSFARATARGSGSTNAAYAAIAAE
jgi:hypothetical protein